jgi:hypothetical protein
MTIASCFIPGTQALTVPRAIAVAVPRMVPVLGRIAVAYGAGDAYRRVTTFFNEQFKEKGEDSGSSKGRIQNTPQEVDRFISTRLTRGICEKWKPIKGRQTYKFTRKEGKFKKDDWFSHDTLHHELEWFNSKGTHKGAIEPKNGTKYKPADPRKNVKMD